MTLSFGFPNWITAVERAIDKLVRERRDKGRDIIFFAAANNDGLNSPEMFPASDPNTIAVRGTTHTGAFLPEYNPNPRPQKAGLSCFGTLAKDVPYDIGDRDSKKSGCSVATPILAGIVATVIQYIGHVAAADTRLQERVRTRDGILQVMSHLADSAHGDQRFKYITPWKFFARDDDERIALVRNALAELQRSH